MTNRITLQLPTTQRLLITTNLSAYFCRTRTTCTSFSFPTTSKRLFEPQKSFDIVDVDLLIPDLDWREWEAKILAMDLYNTGVTPLQAIARASQASQAVTQASQGIAEASQGIAKATQEERNRCTVQNSKSPLLTLPAELRLEIHRHHGRHPTFNDVEVGGLGLLSICHQLREEASLIVWSSFWLHTNVQMKHNGNVQIGPLNDHYEACNFSPSQYFGYSVEKLKLLEALQHVRYGFSGVTISVMDSFPTVMFRIHIETDMKRACSSKLAIHHKFLEGGLFKPLVLAMVKKLQVDLKPVLERVSARQESRGLRLADLKAIVRMIRLPHTPPAGMSDPTDDDGDDDAEDDNGDSDSIF